MSPVVSGKKDTSLIPSISTGVLRFAPNVLKSNPDSVLVVHAMTALPPSKPTSTVSQIISRMRRDTFPTLCDIANYEHFWDQNGVTLFPTSRS